MEKAYKYTEKESKFIEFYIETGNLAKSAKLAGYSNNHSQIGYELINKKKISTEVNKKMKVIARNNETILSAQQVLQELTNIALEDKNSFARLKALELIGKRYKLFTDTIQFEEKKTPTFIDDRVNGFEDSEDGGLFNED